MIAYPPYLIVDSGVMIAFYNRHDRYHQQITDFLVSVLANQ
jgi:predicted nucleic acid-binding protein